MSLQPFALPKTPKTPSQPRWFHHLPDPVQVPLPLPWRSISPPPRLAPATLSSIFPNEGFILSGCVMLWSWFYNSILKSLGYSWTTWATHTTKLVTPQSRFITLRDEFKREPPTARWTSKKIHPRPDNTITPSSQPYLPSSPPDKHLP